MISKVDMTQLMNQARVKLVGASDGGLKAELFDVFAEFFNDSSSWRECLPVNTVPGQCSYPLAVGEGQIIRLMGAWGEQGIPVPAVMPTIGDLQIINAPNVPTTIMVMVAKNVALPEDRNAYPIGPDWVLPVWHVGILDGLCGKMMGQPNKSFSNTTLAVYHLRRFRDAINRARVATQRANTFGTQSWRFPSSFRTSSQKSGVPTWGIGRGF